MSSKKTLVVGASARPSQYSNMAVKQLREAGHPVIALGRESSNIGDVTIVTKFPDQEHIHTVTLYLNPERQKEFEQQIITLHPHRIIFNPGTENPEFMARARENGIEALEACTLVMLSVGNY